MDMLFSPLFSGSSGNCVYIGAGDDAVIVDAGVSATATLEEMKKAGLSSDAVKGILITHEHTDHINGAGVLARKLNVPLYATRGTWETLSRRAGKLQDWQRRVIDRDTDFFVGNINVRPFEISHDCAEPCGYVLSSGSVRCAVAGSELVLLEADYDEDMLLAGSYTYELKRRILGRRGHLSNEDAGKAAVKLALSGTRQVILGHLSKNNNFPELALKTVETALLDGGVRPGRDVALDVARRDGCTGVYRVSDLSALREA